MRLIAWQITFIATPSLSYTIQAPEFGAIIVGFRTHIDFRAHPLLISQCLDDKAHLVYPDTKENSDNNKSSNIISGPVILLPLPQSWVILLHYLDINNNIYTEWGLFVRLLWSVSVDSSMFPDPKHQNFTTSKHQASRSRGDHYQCQLLTYNTAITIHCFNH